MNSMLPMILLMLSCGCCGEDSDNNQMLICLCILCMCGNGCCSKNSTDITSTLS